MYRTGFYWKAAKSKSPEVPVAANMLRGIIPAYDLLVGGNTFYQFPDKFGVIQDSPGNRNHIRAPGKHILGIYEIGYRVVAYEKLPC